MKTRICIEASPLISPRAGLSRYAHNLIQALLRIHQDGDYALSYNRAPTASLSHAFRHLPSYTSNLHDKTWRARNAITYFSGPSMDEFYEGVSLFHSTAHLLPKLNTIPTVLTLHDLIPLLLPRYHKPLNRLFFRLMLPKFLKHADEIIAVSHTTKRDAIALLGLPPDHITVIPEGVTDDFRPITDENTLAYIRNSYGLPRSYILCVSTIEPRKNHITLLRAFERIADHHTELALVLAGATGWLYDDFIVALSNSPVRHRVRLLGKVPDRDLPALLSAATIFAFPSHYEGFGLPPLEAMACSTPVICSSAPSLTEVVGDAAIICPTTDINAWSDQLSHLLETPAKRELLAAAGKTQASNFSWDSAALLTRTVYERAITSK
ncbi:MAG: glycosyltransferase family 4 protein [Anaerolineales bacterium]|nr:glycosyltransferase family 4 protein [Anaerolineales bacterium]